jgi:DNA-binding PadR family transcriptional regulator
MELSPTAYVVLGMLRLGKLNGYEIKQIVDHSTRFFWAASYGQIYPELKKLEQAGLVASTDDPRGGRQRRSYRLTDAGEQTLQQWLLEDSEPGNEMRDEALLKIFFADAVGPGKAAAIAGAASARHSRIVAQLEEVEHALTPEHGMPFVVLTFGLDYHRWCAERFARMQKELED